MIVTPDFLDHWKTTLLIQILDDPEAPLSLLRLWGHCQNRKTYRFDSGKLTPDVLKAITRSRAATEALWNAFVTSGFLEELDDGSIEIHGFYEANSQLVANWENGAKGGRPRKVKQPDKNPSETHPEPKEEMGGTDETGEVEEEEKEKIKQGETGEEEPGRPFSPTPQDKSFWQGKDYSKASVPKIFGYEDIHRINDPIIACMAVSKDRSLGMYGFLVKGLKKCLSVGLSESTLKEYLFELCCRLHGEQKAGERTVDQIAPALVAEMKEFFDGVECPSYPVK